jgi:hypothetical protein
MTIVAEKPGTYFLPDIHVLNLRAQKEFVIKDAVKLHLMFNVFNFFDTQTVVGVNQTTGPYFNQPTAKLSEGVVRLSTRFTF